MFKNIAFICVLAFIFSGCGGDSSDKTTASANNRVVNESYPAYYDKYPRIILKDVMARYFGVNEKGILSFGLDDAAKAGGHMCPIVSGTYLIAREGIKALAQYYKDMPTSDTVSYDYEDGVIYRGGIKVTLGGKDGSGDATNAMAKVLGFITGAESASGFKNGPDYPFANRQNLLLHDPASLPFNPKTGIEVIFTGMKATYTKADKDGKDTNVTTTYEQCKGLWGDCIEHTTCDRSVKVTYKFATPEVMGAAPKGHWPDTINFILENYQKAISVERVPNPKGLCK